MKNSIFSFFGIAICFTLLLTGCKDPCKEYDCGNGTCTEDPNGDPICVCDAGFEGERCAVAFNAKFLGTYTMNDTCDNGGSIDTYQVVVSEGTSANEIMLENFSTYQDPFTAIIASDGLNFTIPAQAFFTGTLEGEGTLNAVNGQIRTSFSFTLPGSSTRECIGTMTPN